MNAADPSPPATWPDILHQGRLADEALGQAYDRLSAVERAWIKTALARLFAVHQGPRPAFAESARPVGPGLVGLTRTLPRPFALFLLDSGFRSPARLLAACLPALLAGTPEAAVVRVGGRGSWPPALVGAMELAGIETLADLSERDLRTLAAELAVSGRAGLVVDLRAKDRPLAPGPLAVIRAGGAPRLGLFAAPEADFDLTALAFAHPDADIEVWGAAGKGLDRPKRRRGPVEAFLRQPYDAVFVPDSLARRALRVFPLALGPGAEPLWFDPRLTPETFSLPRAAFFNDPDGPGTMEQP